MYFCLSLSECRCQVVVKSNNSSMTLLNKTHTHRKKEKKLVHDSSSISITASVSTASDIHLTPDTCHNKDAQNTTTAIPREGVLVERQSKNKTTTTKKSQQQQQESTSRKQTLLQARVFSLSQEVSISLMAALVRQSVTQQLEWRK